MRLLIVDDGQRIHADLRIVVRDLPRDVHELNAIELWLARIRIGELIARIQLRDAVERRVGTDRAAQLNGMLRIERHEQQDRAVGIHALLQLHQSAGAQRIDADAQLQRSDIQTEHAALRHERLDVTALQGGRSRYRLGTH